MPDHKNTTMSESKHYFLKTKSLQYTTSALIDYFAEIQKLPWAFLLHSAANEHDNQRFDILVADPIATLTHHSGWNTLIIGDQEAQTNQSDPFELLKITQSALLPECLPHEHLPFVGGALGYFSYDLGRQIENLPELAITDISIPEMAIGFYDWALIADHQEKTLTLIEPNHSNRLTWLESIRKKSKHPDEHSTDLMQPFQLTSAWLSNMTLDCYHEKFDSVQSYLAAGDCYQINLAQRFHAEYDGDEWQAFQTLAHHNGAPFSAFLRLPDSVIISVSPERFLQLKQNQIETKPIKGTRPRHIDPLQDHANKLDLLTAEKDRAENLMIVDLLRNDIGRVATPGSVNVPTLFNVESFPAVHHLVSTVTGELDDKFQATDLLKACFPGGSITGAPKVRAMEIIEELEPHRRSLYCGAIGYISRCQTMDTNIAIRTLVCHQNKIYAWAGGGIIADSQVDAEYQETLDKLSKILPKLSK